MHKSVTLFFFVLLGFHSVFAADVKSSTHETPDSFEQLFSHWAVDALISKARHGNAQAQYQLYVLYSGFGDVLEKDERKSVYWLKKSARQGHPLAENALGMYYSVDKKDRQKAITWYQKSAKHGNSMAFSNLGAQYFEIKNYNKAFHHYYRAAIFGDSCAYYAIGQMYANGMYVKQDHQLAHDSFLASANLGFPQTKWQIAKTDFNMRIHQYAEYEAAKVAHRQLPKLETQWLLNFDYFDQKQTDGCMTTGTAVYEY